MRTHAATKEGYDVAVPNKTIYVSDGDLPLYQRAQELAGGNLSSAIAKALRRFVDTAEGLSEGYEEITVRVGIGRGRKVRFTAVLVGEFSDTIEKRFEHYKRLSRPDEQVRSPRRADGGGLDGRRGG